MLGNGGNSLVTARGLWTFVASYPRVLDFFASDDFSEVMAVRGNVPSSRCACGAVRVPYAADVEVGGDEKLLQMGLFLVIGGFLED